MDETNRDIDMPVKDTNAADRPAPRIRLPGPLLRLVNSPLKRDMYLIIVGLMGTAAAITLDAAAIPLWATLFVGLSITVITVLVERAISTSDDSKRILPLAAALTLAMGLLFGVYAYHIWLDPTRDNPTAYTFYVNGSEAHILRPSGKPGGPPLALSKQLYGSNSYEFTCYAIDVDGEQWLKIAEYNLWVERVYLSPVMVHDSDIPKC